MFIAKNKPVFLLKSGFKVEKSSSLSILNNQLKVSNSMFEIKIRSSFDDIDVFPLSITKDKDGYVLIGNSKGVVQTILITQEIVNNLISSDLFSIPMSKSDVFSYVFIKKN